MQFSNLNKAGFVALAICSISVFGHPDGGSAVPGVDSLPLNSLASAGKDPLNSNLASDGGASVSRLLPKNTKWVRECS
jgi:hypothetical protein